MSVIVSSPAPAHAVPLIGMNPELLAAWLPRQSERVRNWLAAHAFVAAPYTHCALPDEAGGVAGVLVGVKRADDPFALAHLPLALPLRDYCVNAAGLAIDAGVAALSWGLGAYQFTRYRAAKRAPATLHVPPGDSVADALAMLAATTLVRDLVNTPTEDMGPEQLAQAASAIARANGAQFREWVGDELLDANFPAIHAVGRASHRPPRLVELTWGDASHPRVALVGKGVCFDSGGLDMKTADGMRLMKKDMGGAAHALALAQLVMQAKLRVHLHVLVPAVENSIASNAYQPGVVIRTRKGVTVEIHNTDAEGRVILCDALAYASEPSPALLLDFATLTGAARVALGPDLPALFSNDEVLAQTLLAHGERLADPLWRMPLWQPYRAFLDSPIADMTNAGTKTHGGAIVAALYLQSFVPDSVPWAHIDLFAWSESARPGRPVGGDAHALRACYALLAERYR